MRRVVVCVLALVFAACGDDAASIDGGIGRDASGFDASGSDASGLDASGADGDVGRDASGADGGADGDAGARDAGEVEAGVGPALPPVNGSLDYQLGGAYPPPRGVTIVARDRTDAPAAGLYNVCYVNGFQIQPGEEAAWMRDHPSLVLRDTAGDPVIDVDWGEMLIDTRSPAQRTELAGVIGAWIEGCAADGFDAVEIDNLDSYARSRDLLTPDDNVAALALFAARAHAAGLAIAQKNATELVPRRAELGTDFVVAEECNTFAECDAYIAGYGVNVLMIEYERADFDVGCRAYPDFAIVLRDVDLVPGGAGGYVFDGC